MVGLRPWWGETRRRSYLLQLPFQAVDLVCRRRNPRVQLQQELCQERDLQVRCLPLRDQVLDLVFKRTQAHFESVLDYLSGLRGDINVAVFIVCRCSCHSTTI